MAPYKILKQGYMMKEPPASKRGLRRKLHRYWFVLVEDPQQVALVYFKNEDSYISRQRNEGFIRVDNSISINVISEHLGSKNAFVIKSVRTDYTLVPESRYDLHEWLFTLHNAIEAFKTKQRKAEELRRMPLRLRANTVDAIAVLPPASSDSSGSLRTITPTRRAPPAPPTAATGHTGSSPRRKPVRPAPVAPRGRSNSQTHPTSPMSSVSSTPGMGGARDETPPPAYPDSSTVSPGISQEVRGNGENPGMFEHPVMDLEISQTDRDEFHHQLSCPQGSEISEVPRPKHSVSDTLLLMHQNSASLPDLINCEGVTRANVGVATQEGLSGEGIDGPIRQRSVSESRHTRHLSLTGHEDIHAKRQPRDKKKRSARRNGSIKLRSRSPPNLPPPPPPAAGMGELQEQTEEAATTGRQTFSELVEWKNTDLSLLPPPAQQSGDLASQSGSSVGFSEVMNTISNIDHELDEIAVSPVKPSIPAPRRTNGAKEQQDENELAVGEADNDFNEEEWLCDVPYEATPISPNRPTPEGGPQSAEEDSETELNVSKIQKASLSHPQHFVPANKLVSGGFIPAAVIETTMPTTDTQSTSDPQAKPAKGKHRVMFKEEVEDIPSYEPRVDQEADANEDDEIPVGVAALKKKLFGVAEQETTKYKKEGVLSPKHTHPTNVQFGTEYEFKQESSPFYRESSPNVNNNNGSDGEQATPRLADQQQSKVSETEAIGVAVASSVPPSQSTKPRQEGLYETPWEKSAVSKYKVIGRIRNGSAGKTTKERTPPPVSPKTKKGIQFGEVSTSETPTPGSTEIRNVHSLERTKLKKERIQQGHSYSLDRVEQKEALKFPPAHSVSLNHVGPKELSSPPHTKTSPRTLTSPGLSAVDDDDLLASITNTLQKQSKYGSITLLSPPTSSLSGAEPAKPKKVQSEVRRSARGELEKIRAAHRREPPSPPMGLAATPPHRYPQGPTTAAHASPHRTAAAMHASPQRNFIVAGATRNFTAPAPTSTSPQGMFTTPVPAHISPGATRTSPRMVSPTMHSSPLNLQGGGATVAQASMTFAQQPWWSPPHTSSKSNAPHHSSQILTSPTHRSWGAPSKRRMFSGRPRMAASLDELQADPSTQVTYDANSKSHIFRSLV